MRFALALSAVLVLFSSPTLGQEPTPPPIVVNGLQALVSVSIDSAVVIWMKGSSLEGDTAAAGQVTNAFRTLPAWLGKPIGFEVIKTFALGGHVRRTYALLLLDGGPMYFRFTYYLGSKGWVLLHLDFNTEEEKILPPGLLLP